jgi:protein BCP1
MHVHRQNPGIQGLVKYLFSKTGQESDVGRTLKAILDQEENHVGFVLSERLINMPVQVVPPMYRMLADEIQWAINDVRELASLSQAC